MPGRGGILLVADDVVTGFGRLGSMFGPDHYGLKPELITCARGLTSTCAPLSGTAVGQRVRDVPMQGTDESGAPGHGRTSSAQPIGAAAGIANLGLIDRLGLIESAGTVGAHLNEQMAAAAGDNPHMGEMRGEGMPCAVELVQGRDSRTFFEPGQTIGAKVVGAMLKRAVIARAMPQDGIIGLAPPLHLPRAGADQIAATTAGSLAEIFG